MDMFDTFKKKTTDLLSKINKKPDEENILGKYPEYDQWFLSIVREIKEIHQFVYAGTQLKFTQTDTYQRLKKLDAAEKKQFVVYLQAIMISTYKQVYSSSAHGTARNKNTQGVYEQYAVAHNLFSLLMRSKLSFSGDELLAILTTYIESRSHGGPRFSDWPIGFTANQFVNYIKQNVPSEAFIAQAKKLLESEEFSQGRLWSGMDIGAAKEKMVNALQAASGDDREILIAMFEADEEDDFGVHLNAFTRALPNDEQAKWNELLLHCRHSNGAKPKKKWSDRANELIAAIDPRKYKKSVVPLLEVAAALKFEEKECTYVYNDNTTWDYTTTVFLKEKNRDVLKGLVWTLVRFHDTKTLNNLAQLGEKCFQKIPGVGPAAASLGNACIYVLAQSKGMEGIAHLSRLKLRIKQNNTQKLIQNYIEEQAKKQGLLPSQIEEIAAPDFGLEDGERTEDFEDFKLILRITGVGKTTLSWIKPDGKPQKTVPAFVKNHKKYTDKLKTLRNMAKQVKQVSTAQRDRIDRLYTENRTWVYDDFMTHYIRHGLVSTIAKKLIWSVKQGDNWIPVFLFENQWQDIKGRAVTLDKASEIRLWHPIHSTPEEVLVWREKLEQWQIQQPMKQAYREVYLLTDAEVNTRVYSNRMAAHFIKQHQFNALAALRGWKFSLMGCYDDGRDGDAAEKELPVHDIKAQFWIYEVYDDNESWNDAGIWDYVTTDQVRFVGVDGEPIELVNIDRLVFSEVMRDVDLFVGVASVGNDPQWQDNGGQVQRDYWQSYSFGDLSEIAKTRKQVLERLLPRLKIKDVAKIDGKFLVVKGKRHTYKIHIGSTNILISPNDQYLCIVPSRSKDKNLDNVFLPFEGDKGLSVVLSKAFMLAEDDKIKDKTILSQI